MKGQELTFHREFDKDFDRFAVAGKTLLSVKLAASIVGHVPLELSRHIQYLAQGGLEILIEMSIVWDDAVKIKKVKEKLKTVEIGNFTDQSNEILRE